MIKQVIVIRKDLNMRKGKMIAQGAHASMQFLISQIKNKLNNKEKLNITLSDDHVDWIVSELNTKIVVSVNSEQELKQLIEKAIEKKITVHEVVDSGKTEFNGIPTLTCAAFGPAEANLIDLITGHLPLL